MQCYVMRPGLRGLEALARVTRPDPAPGAGQVVVRVRAVSLNYRDSLILNGRYLGATPAAEVVPLSDGAGEVVAVGSGVTRCKVGDRVAGTFFLGWNDGPPTADDRPGRGAPGADGMLAELVVSSEHDLVHLPAHLDFQQGATLPCAGVTAWHALVEASAIRPGQSVLVLGSGGVSVFALQFARAAGATVIMTSSSDAKLERGRALGADHLINYRRTPDWDAEVMRITAGRGVDCVVEVGGLGTLAKSMSAVAHGGRIEFIGVLTQGTDMNPWPLLRKTATLHGIYVGSRAMFEAMNRALAANRILPVVDRVFPFAQAAEAYRHLASGEHFGKVVIEV